MHVLPEILLTDLDSERLDRVISSHSGACVDYLDEETARAQVVPQKSIPPDVVTMNSEVTYEDCYSGVQRTIRIVYPGAADSDLGRVSVLSPVGCALLGMRVGQITTWHTPRGRSEVRVVAVPYQPEAAGDFGL